VLQGIKLKSIDVQNKTIEEQKKLEQAFERLETLEAKASEARWLERE
jgi:hypothetical protein